MDNKTEVNENKIILKNFSCTIYKMDRDGGNKTLRLSRCGFSYALSKLRPPIIQASKKCAADRKRASIGCPNFIEEPKM